KVVDEQTCAVTSAADPVQCEFDTAVGGQYRVTAVVAGTDGGRNRTELTTWVSGAEAQPTRGVEQQTLTVVPDQQEYAPGDTAELLVQAPFAAGEGLLTISRNGLRDTVRFAVVDGSAVVEVPITEASVPQLSLNLEVVGSTTRTADDGTSLPDAPQRPAYAVGTMTLSVPPVSRTLTVDATPRDTELLPGGATTIDVSVTDANGAGVEGAEFAVVVVDEAVLALSGYTLADPLSVFYAPGYDWLTAVYGRQQIRLLDPKLLAGGDDSGNDSGNDGGATATTEASAEGGSPEDTAAPSEEQSDGDAAFDPAAAPGTIDPVDVRSDFDALALFEPSVVTDAKGAASIEVTLPDSLTRYRVMVVAVSGNDRFGSTESNITALLPLSVRPSAPRFANFGDSFELPVVVQNQTDAALEVEVVLQTSNLDQPGADAGATGRRVTVPANDRIEVRFPVATDSAGTAGFRVTAVSGDLADSATVELPVYTPATAEAFATYGVIDSGAIDQPLLAPTDVVPGYGGLEVTTSSTSLQALTDALLYLAEYEYDSSDARAARIMAIAALADVLDAFDAAELPSKAELDASVDADVAGLVALQNDDGGFPFWKTYERSEPFNSVQATHALLLARENGYAVPAGAVERALAFIADIESHFPAGYGPQERLSVSAYALWVRAFAGQTDAAKAETLYDRSGDEMTTDALAWVWGSIADSGMRADIERTLGNRAVETAGAANFVTDYDDSAYLIMQSDRRTDGIVLDALIANAPDSDLIPKVVAGLLANRVKGRWD
ncbi:MAG: alpha-2-macroglobulin family protein, partial [Actinomycetota bacterium]|nr:alpha-2-macroglobulin family protein [Actinomycetota bacterium]